MSDEQVLTITEPAGPSGYPSIDEIGKSAEEIFQAGKASQEQIQAQMTELVVGIVDDLVSGKNPLASKTLIFNGVLIIAGIVGSIYTLAIAGNTAAAVPFLISTATGAINSILRMLTSGPILTQGMQKIVDACVKLPPKPAQIPPQ